MDGQVDAWQVARYLGYTDAKRGDACINRLVRDGKFLQPIQDGKKKNRWWAQDVREWAKNADKKDIKAA